MSLLPKSIHRCRRYPTKFNSGRDIPTQLAVRVSADNSDVWIYDLVRDTQTRLTFDPVADSWPVWTPDGQRVAFGRTGGMFWKAADGTGEVEPLVENASNQRPQALSPDGTVLVFEGFERGW